MILKKKLAVLGLAAVMTVAFMPAMAFADGTGNTATTTNSTQTTTTKTIPDNGVLTTGTYQLTDNITHSISIAQGQEVTLDLNNYEINVSSGDAIVNSGKLVINGSGNVNATRAAIGNTPTGNCTVNGGSYSSSTWYTIKNLGTMTINDATITSNDNTNGSSVIDNGWYGKVNGQDTANDKIGDTIYSESDHKADATLTINGGSVTGNGNSSTAVKNDDYGVFNMTGGTLDNTECEDDNQPAFMNWNEATISGGTIKGVYAISTEMEDSTEKNKGHLTITGGNFVSTDDSMNIYPNEDTDDSAKGSVSISGGTFEEGIDESLSPNNVSVTGGTFGYIDSSVIASNVPTATVSSGSTTTYAVGQDAIAKAAEDSSNTVTVTKGSVSLTGANAKIVNDESNTKGTVTVDGQTVAAGKSVTPSAATTIANLKSEIASLRSQLAQAQAAANQSSANASASDQQITQLKKDLADAQAQLKTAQAKADEQNSTLTAPAQVINLKAKAGKRYVKLTWTALQSNATGYRVYRKVKGGKYSRVKTLTKADASSWTNKGLKKGKTYYYKVRAYKSITSGELWGAYSNTAKAKVK